MADERDDTDMTAVPRIEQTPNAKKLRTMLWFFPDVGLGGYKHSDVQQGCPRQPSAAT